MQYSPTPRGCSARAACGHLGAPWPTQNRTKPALCSRCVNGGAQWRPKSPRGRPKGPTWAPQGRFWEAREALSEGKFAIGAPCENPSIYYVFTTF